MMKDEPEKLDLRSHDIVEDKRQELVNLFPEIRTEGGKLDFERLKLALGEAVDVGKERYGMNWPGKADCFKTIQMPSLATLRPCPEESINFATTENLINEAPRSLLRGASSGRTYSPPDDTGWRYAADRMQKLIDTGCVLFPSRPDGRPREKKFRADLQTDFVAFASIIDDIFTGDGTAEIRALFGEEVFDFSKPSALLARLVKQGAGDDAVVLDFFAGSGSTAHAVLDLNKQDGGNRKFILVQLPEPTERKDFPTIADITKERVVCLDAGFAGNDQLKANAVQIFKTKGVTSFKTV